MDGSISVESTLHEGTTFTVTLTHRIAEHAGTKKADTQKEALDAAVLAGIRILLAEDNALNAEIAETILQDMDEQEKIRYTGSNKRDAL